VWVSVCFINLGELDRRACNGRITSLGILQEKVVILLVVKVFFLAREPPYVSSPASYRKIERGVVPLPSLSESLRWTREPLIHHLLVFFVSPDGSAPGDIPCYLSIRNVPSVDWL
jgi:hypothetical protein